MSYNYSRNNYALRSHYSKHRSNSGKVTVAIVVLIALGFIFLNFWVSRASEKHQVFTVTRLDDQTSIGGTSHSHKYLVFGRNEFGKSVVFEDTDSFWFFKFNSSNLFGELQQGHKYSCSTSGFRFAMSSSYPNLIKCSEVS